MLERSAEIDDLAGRIFLAEHFCSRAIQAPEASEPVGEVRVWMELNDFDQAPIARSAGTQVVLRSALVGVAPDPRWQPWPWPHRQSIGWMARHRCNRP